MSSENVYASESTSGPRPGMSGTSKVLVGLGIGCGFLLLLACGGVVAAFYWLKGMQTTDPAEIRKFADEIVAIDIPPAFKPIMAINMNAKWATEKSFVMVLFGNEKGHLALAQISGAGDEAAVEQMRAQMELSLSQQNQAQKGFAIENTEKHETEIHDQPAHFTITSGKNKDGKEMREAKGDFLGSKGPALLVFIGDGADFSEEDITNMLDSMK